MTDAEQLTAAVKAQQESIQQLTGSVDALAQCVAMLLEEETGIPEDAASAGRSGTYMDGTPVAEAKPDPVETDWDGNPIA